MLKQQIEQDLKEALLGGQKDRATTLRGLKSVILYAEVAAGSREQGLSDEQIVQLFAKEAKKRQESADFYVKGGSQERADAELVEKKIIESYLPQQLSDEELLKVVDDAMAFARRSRLLIGFSKYWDCLTTATIPACWTLRLKRRSKFSSDSFESLRVTWIISILILL